METVVETPKVEEEPPKEKYKVVLQEGIVIDPNESYEDDKLMYVPINALKFNWDLYEKTMPDQIAKIKADYAEDKDSYNIIGLVVYKATGGWCWSGTPLITEEEQRDFLNRDTPETVWQPVDRYPNQDYVCSPCMEDPKDFFE